MGHPDEEEWRQDAAMDAWFEEQVLEQSYRPVFAYLARHGDAIQERVDACLREARSLEDAGFAGAALVRAAAGLEIAMRFFVVRPLVLGAFLSDEWSATLTAKITTARSADDRALLPAILRLWDIDVTSIKLSGGQQFWETLSSVIWPQRNNYVHAGGSSTDEQANLAVECVTVLLDRIVAPTARKLGFTREQTGKWCVVNSSHDPDINPPHHYDTASPFEAE